MSRAEPGERVTDPGGRDRPKGGTGIMEYDKDKRKFMGSHLK